MNGTERRIDALGRIVLPANIRNKLGLKTNSKVFICLNDDAILITSAEKHCALCGHNIDVGKELRLCADCIEKVKNSH